MPPPPPTPLSDGWHRHILPAWCAELLAVYADDAGRVFLGGFSGLARRDPGGEVTHCALRGRSNFVKSIDGAGGDVVAILHRGTACSSQDAGASWTQRRSGLPEGNATVCCLGGGRVLISGGGLVRSRDGGRRFEAIEPTPEVTRVRRGYDGALYGLSYRVTEVLRSTDGGATWEALGGINPPDGGREMHLLGVAHLRGDTLFALTFHGVYRSDDLGATWALCGGDGINLKALDTDGDRLVVAVGSGGALLRSTDGGDTFQLDDTGVPGDFTQVHCRDGQAWVISRDTLLSWGVEVAEAEPPPPIGAEEPVAPPPETWHHPPQPIAPSKAPPRDDGPPLTAARHEGHACPVTGGCFWGERVITADMSGLLLIHERGDAGWRVVARHTTPHSAPADHFARHRDRLVCLLRHDLWSFDPDSGAWFEHGRLPVGHRPDRIIVRGDRLYVGHHLGVLLMTWDDDEGTWREAARVRGDSLQRDIDLNPEGTRLLCRAGRFRKPELHLLNAEDLTTEAVIRGDYSRLGALFTADEALIIVHGSLGFHASPSFILRRVASGRASGKGVAVGDDSMMHLLMTPDRATAVALHRTNRVHVIDVASRRVLASRELREAGRDLSGAPSPEYDRAPWPRVAALSEDGARLLVGDGTGEVVVLDLTPDGEPVLGAPQTLSRPLAVPTRPVARVTRLEADTMAATRAGDTIYALLDDHTLYTVAMDGGEVGYCGGGLLLRRSEDDYYRPGLTVVGDVLFYTLFGRCDAFDLVTGAQLWEGELIQGRLVPWHDGYAYTFANGHYDQATRRRRETLYRVHARTGVTARVQLPPPPDGDGDDAAHYFGRLIPTPRGMLLHFSHEDRVQSYLYNPEHVEAPISAPMPPLLSATGPVQGLSRNGRYLCSVVEPRGSGWTLTDLSQGTHEVGRFVGESHHLVRDGIQHVTASDDGLLVVGLSPREELADLVMWARDGALLAIYRGVPAGPVALTRDARTALIWNKAGIHRVGLAEWA